MPSKLAEGSVTTEKAAIWGDVLRRLLANKACPNIYGDLPGSLRRASTCAMTTQRISTTFAVPFLEIDKFVLKRICVGQGE